RIIEGRRQDQEATHRGRSSSTATAEPIRLLEEIDADTYATNAQELRDEAATLRLEIERCDRGRNETIDIAVKAFELLQSLRAKWFAADHAAKRRLLEIVCLNFSLVDVSLVPAMRKPFDLLAEGLLQKK